MNASAYPAIGTVVAAILGAVGASGWSGEARLMHRAASALDLAPKVRSRRLRADLFDAAHDDIAHALLLRRTGGRWKGAVTTATISGVGLWFIPWWVAGHPEQGRGGLGVFWAVLFIVYGLCLLASATAAAIALLTRRRS